MLHAAAVVLHPLLAAGYCTPGVDRCEVRSRTMMDCCVETCFLLPLAAV